jgi:signal transduction histidine kinase
MLKAAVAIKTEIAVYERLYRQQGRLEIKKHSLHRVVMNAVYKFFPDFTEEGILLSVPRTEEMVMVDYDCAAIVLYHLLDNARKYAHPGKEILVIFRVNGDWVETVLDMVSAKIENEEVEKIYEEGYTGINAKRLERGGTGYGMAVVRELVARASMQFRIERDVNRTERLVRGDVPYVRNRFVLGVTRWRRSG